MRRKSRSLILSDATRGRDGMMAAPCGKQYFLTQSLSLWLLALVFTVTWRFSVQESYPPIHLEGEVGGNVTIHCPFESHRTIKFFYFQRGETFVNGYYESRNITDTQGVQTWENTRVDHGNTTVHMTNLNMSHMGTYRCHIMYTNSQSTFDRDVDLRITGKYSKPEVTVKCTDVFSCLVMCSSHGGYPKASMMLNVPDSQVMKVVNSSEMPDPHTMTFNSSSSATFNCSGGELTSLSCSVGEVTSDMFSVCVLKDPPDPTVTPDTSHYVIVTAICAVAVFSIMMASLLWWQCRKGNTGAASVDVRLEWGVDGQDEEAAQLSEKNGGEEAS